MIDLAELYELLILGILITLYALKAYKIQATTPLGYSLRVNAIVLCALWGYAVVNRFVLVPWFVLETIKVALVVSCSWTIGLLLRKPQIL
jgi:hypothetical protein